MTEQLSTSEAPGTATSPREPPADTADYWKDVVAESYRNLPTRLSLERVRPSAWNHYTGLPLCGNLFTGICPIPSPMVMAQAPSFKSEEERSGEPRKRRKTPYAHRISEIVGIGEQNMSSSTSSTAIVAHAARDTWVSSPAEQQSMTVLDLQEVKKERRKQSNRESARRSRLRKQKQCEFLNQQVHDLTRRNEKLERELEIFRARNNQLEKELKEVRRGFN